MAIDLKKEVFNPIARRIYKRRDSLRGIKKFRMKIGIEGWLKVEIIAALKGKISSPQNKGPDLRLQDKTGIELKAATDFNPPYLMKGALKYNCSCVFLGDAGDKKLLEKLLLSEKVKVIGRKVFNDGENDWIIGMIQPSRKG